MVQGLRLALILHKGPDPLNWTLAKGLICQTSIIWFPSLGSNQGSNKLTMSSELKTQSIAQSYVKSCFLRKFLEDIVLFFGPLMPLFWTSGDVYSGFQSQGGSLVYFLACVIIRFTFCVTYADCVGVNMAAEGFQSTYLQMYPQALAEVQDSNPWMSVHWAQCCKPFGHYNLTHICENSRGVN